jgi:hypothetical protein
VRCALPAGWAHFPGGEVVRLRASPEQVTAELDCRLLNERLKIGKAIENLPFAIQQPGPIGLVGGDGNCLRPHVTNVAWAGFANDLGRPALSMRTHTARSP